MSQFVDCETIIQDSECLVQALAEVGYPLEKLVIVYEQNEDGTLKLDAKGKPIMVAQHLYGYKGDVRQQTAEIVIPRHFIGSLSNDVGFKRQDDGSWTAIISEYDRHRFHSTWVTHLQDEYNVKVVEKQLKTKRRPYRIQRQDGEILLIASRK